MMARRTEGASTRVQASSWTRVLGLCPLPIGSTERIRGSLAPLNAQVLGATLTPGASVRVCPLDQVESRAAALP